MSQPDASALDKGWRKSSAGPHRRLPRKPGFRADRGRLEGRQRSEAWPSGHRESRLFCRSLMRSLSPLRSQRQADRRRGRALRHRAWPVAGDSALRLGERQLSRANEGMQRVLDPIFHLGSDCSAAWLGPEVSRVRWMPTEFERNEVVLFVVGRVRVCIAILGDLSHLEAGRVRRWRSDLPRVAWHADRLSDSFRCDFRVHDAGCAVEVGEW